jgi:hypothetical protein
MKHTKGPWVVREMYRGIDGGYTIEHISEGLRSVVAELNEWWLCAEHGGCGAPSNARLIAAAPDMLEACKEAEDMFAQYGEMYGFTEMAPHCWGAIECLREAIRKATE